jgi:hypothetical protein
MSVRNYQYTLRYNPDEGRFHRHHGGNLMSLRKTRYPVLVRFHILRVVNNGIAAFCVLTL